MWSSLVDLNLTEDDIVRGLGEQFAVAPARLRADLAAFRRRALDEGLLVQGPVPSDPPKLVPVPPRGVPFPELAAWRALRATARGLRRDGFAKTYQACAALPAPTPLPRPDATLARALAAFARAENFFVHPEAPADCLPRSLALFRFLRAIGLRAEHVIGVHRMPFCAHAWVEFAGDVVLDADRRATFKPLARLAT
jgi:hypothetical protein